MTVVTTWNVNSLKARLEVVEAWLSEVGPDILCIQETKLADDAYPALSFAGLGYESVHHGEGRWNGVAILSKQPISDVVHGFAEGIEPDVDARLLTARCGDVLIVTAYAPNGRALDDPHYAYKLSWYDRLIAHLDAVSSPDDRIVVCGDLNIAPNDRDVWDLAEVHGATHVSQPERDRFEALLEWGLVDAVRIRYPDADRLYTWWDYRAGNFHKHKGMRIDHVLISQAITEDLDWVLVDRNARKGKGTSDHTPLLVSFDA